VDGYFPPIRIMAADNDIKPLIPGWPSRSVTEKSGTQNRRHQPRPPEQEVEDSDIDTEESIQEEKKKTEPGHIDEYA
jgi:hypothetical protein